jgi:hypothetical protein
MPSDAEAAEGESRDEAADEGRSAKFAERKEGER